MEDKFYYKDGTTTRMLFTSKILHREDGPAIEYKNGGRLYYKDNKLHREDGPAIEYGDCVEYYIDDEYYIENDYWRKIRETTNSTVLMCTCENLWLGCKCGAIEKERALERETK